MPRKDLPRYTIPVTLSENQVERLEELAGKIGIQAHDSNSQVILVALAKLDILVREGASLEGDSVFNPGASDV